mgnify:CR=1 FL=1
MYNAKLNSFKVRKAMVDDVRENMLICSFRVSGDVNPGIYFGKITQESRIKGKTCKSTQGFSLIVTGDGEISLEGRIGDAAVTVSGPVDSFPEADQLAVSVSEVEQAQMAQVDEALVKKSQEEGLSIQSYKALDIKLYADGAEVEPVGPINVAFKNLELENVILRPRPTPRQMYRRLPRCCPGRRNRRIPVNGSNPEERKSKSTIWMKRRLWQMR